MADYRRDVRKILEANGCSFVRMANGSHELWESPISGNRFVVQKNLKSKISANNIMKQAGVDHKFK
ncbi:addiction module toxin, HicA family [Altererythrobacter oceanensis]|uniref:Addiction module toxin, HicA family n=1 Tax=Qipengyuania oceanensis TaxID=1463597 RepID=A0A844YKF1_9SPHN|nr:addiction module toxin, HicA family [Qipengyuania oceanensis]